MICRQWCPIKIEVFNSLFSHTWTQIGTYLPLRISLVQASIFNILLSLFCHDKYIPILPAESGTHSVRIRTFPIIHWKHCLIDLGYGRWSDEHLICRIVNCWLYEILKIIRKSKAHSGKQFRIIINEFMRYALIFLNLTILTIKNKMDTIILLVNKCRKVKNWVLASPSSSQWVLAFSHQSIYSLKRSSSNFAWAFYSRLRVRVVDSWAWSVSI